MAQTDYNVCTLYDDYRCENDKDYKVETITISWTASVILIYTFGFITEGQFLPNPTFTFYTSMDYRDEKMALKKRYPMSLLDNNSSII